MHAAQQIDGLRPPSGPVWVRVAAAAFAAFGCGGTARDDAPPPWRPPVDSSALHPVHIARPAASARLATELTEHDGAPAAIGCPTCHVAGTVAPLAEIAQLPAVHEAVRLRHGSLSCSACHDSTEPSLLHDASGASFSFSDSMRLCSQCHGPIRAAYDHGAHGGMRGYWDLQRGPRTRNDCITCHDPHGPAYPQVQPAEGPRDRFAPPPRQTPSLVEYRFPEERDE